MEEVSGNLLNVPIAHTPFKIIRLQKKMLNRANPFDSAHEAQTVYFKTSGTVSLTHKKGVQM